MAAALRGKKTELDLGEKRGASAVCYRDACQRRPNSFADAREISGVDSITEISMPRRIEISRDRGTKRNKQSTHAQSIGKLAFQNSLITLHPTTPIRP